MVPEAGRGVDAASPQRHAAVLVLTLRAADRLGCGRRDRVPGFFSTNRFTVSDICAPFLVQYSMRSCWSMHLGRRWSAGYSGPPLPDCGHCGRALSRSPLRDRTASFWRQTAPDESSASDTPIEFDNSSPRRPTLLPAYLQTGIRRAVSSSPASCPEIRRKGSSSFSAPAHTASTTG